MQCLLYFSDTLGLKVSNYVAKGRSSTGVRFLAGAIHWFYRLVVFWLFTDSLCVSFHIRDTLVHVVKRSGGLGWK